MKHCPTCGCKNDERYVRCGSCGAELPAADAPPPPLPPPPEMTPAAPAEKPLSIEAPGASEPARTSAMAKTSLALGTVGLFLFLNSCGEFARQTVAQAAQGGTGYFGGVFSLIGGICGMVAWVQIKRSNGRLKGRGLALAGLCIFGLASFLWLTLVPAQSAARRKALRIMCASNLKQLALGVNLYAKTNQDRYPAGDHWCDAILPYAAQTNLFHCPTAPAQARCTYAFNARLSGLDVSKVNPDTVLLFEIPDGWNVSGGLEQALLHDPHQRVCIVALADGRLQLVLLTKLSQLRWDPTQ